MKKPTRKQLEAALEEIATYILPVYTMPAYPMDAGGKFVKLEHAEHLRTVAKEALHPAAPVSETTHE